MKLTLKVGAAIGIAAIGACTQAEQDNGAGIENSATAAEETVLPPDEGDGTTDTLGNQLDQLNESAAGSNSAVASNDTDAN
jgi:hypothetical protein